MRRKAERIDLLSGPRSSNTAADGRRPRPTDTRNDPWASRDSRPRGIDFGSPSNNREKATSQIPWKSLITRGLHGGISGIFGGGGVLGAIGGLRTVITSVMHLFGSKKTPPPLTLFKLPDSQAQTVYVNHQASSSQSQSPIYASTSHQPVLQYQNAEIAQAVKQALLNSSSLNDVLSEL